VIKLQTNHQIEIQDLRKGYDDMVHELQRKIGQLESENNELKERPQIEDNLKDHQEECLTLL